MRAVINKDIRLAELVAEFPSTDLNAVDDKGWSALDWACSEQLVEMTKFCLTLLSFDSGIACPDGSTAFDIGYSKSPESQNDNVLSRLFYESTFSRDEMNPQGALLRLLTLTEPEDTRTKFPGEFLLDPARGGDEPLVKGLLKRGIGLTATTDNDETALHLAAKGGHPDVARTLLEMPSRGKKIDLHAVADDDMTALHCTAKKGSPETVRILVGGRSKVEAVSKGGKAGFHHAAQQASPETVRVLVRGGAKVETVSEGGKTALHLAAETASPATVQELVDLGANKEVARDDRQMGLHIAAKLPTADAARVLLELNANPGAKGNDGRTPLGLAAESSNDGITQGSVRFEGLSMMFN